MSIESMLTAFVVNPARGALCIHGPWGTGKTFLWKRVTHEAKVPSTYVSLFGIDSLESLKAQIALAVQDQTSAPASKWNPRTWSWVRKFTPKIFKSASLIPARFGGGAGLTHAANALAFYFVKSRLICIDDVERRGKNLALIDVLGLISHLDEQRGCRVCMILNSNALSQDDKSAWADQREKVFAAELHFNPSVDQVLQFSFGTIDQLQNWYPIAVEAVRDLKVQNIRVIHRIARSLRLAFEGLPALLEGTTHQIARDVVFLEYCHSGRGAAAPTLEYVSHSSSMAWAVERLRAEKGEATINAEHSRWYELISSYGIEGGDPLTQILLKSIQAGFTDTSSLIEVVRQKDSEARAAHENSRFSASWRRYRDDLSATEESVLNEMMDTWPTALSSVSGKNAESFAQLLRGHGKHASASQAIVQWVGARSGDRVAELEGDELSFFGPITDPEFLAEIERQRLAFPQSRPSLDTALNEIALKNASEVEFDVVASVDVADLAAGLKRRSETLSLITMLLYARHETSGPRGAAGRATLDALRLIASESEWQRLRIKSTYGTELD